MVLLPAARSCSREDERAEGLARELGRRGSTIERLTAREREVVALLCEGRVNKEIANELVLAPRTVDAYLRGIFAKLEVDRRAAASFAYACWLAIVAARADAGSCFCGERPLDAGSGSRLGSAEVKMAGNARQAHTGRRKR